jgi:hypothetical protein
MSRSCRISNGNSGKPEDFSILYSVMLIMTQNDKPLMEISVYTPFTLKFSFRFLIESQDMINFKDKIHYHVFLRNRIFKHNVSIL